MEMEHIRATSKMQHLDKAIADLKSSILTLSTNSPNDKQYLRRQIRQSISAFQDQVDEVLHERPDEERIGLEIINVEKISSCTTEKKHIQGSFEMQHLDKAIADLKSSVLNSSPTTPDNKQSVRNQLRQTSLALADQVDRLLNERPDEADGFVSWPDKTFRIHSTLQKIKPTTEEKSTSAHSLPLAEYNDNGNKGQEQKGVTVVPVIEEGQ